MAKQRKSNTSGSVKGIKDNDFWIPHQVQLQDDKQLHLLVARNQVSNAQYEAFIESRGYQNKNLWSRQGWKWLEEQEFDKPAYWGMPGYLDEKLPVTGVSFWEAEAFATWFGASLPNEEIWFEICTNGRRSPLPWGDSQPTTFNANLSFFGEHSPSSREPLESYPEGVNRNGVHDLIGNVAEWCIPEDLMQLPSGVNAVLRGGSCWQSSVSIDCSFRDEISPNTRDNQTGIRLIRFVDTKVDNVDYDSQLVSHPLQSNPGTLKVKAKRRKLRRPTSPFRQEGIPKKDSIGDYIIISRDGEPQLSVPVDELRNNYSKIEGLFVCVCRWADKNIFEGILLKNLIDLLPTGVTSGRKFMKFSSWPGPDGREYESTLKLSNAVRDKAMLAWGMDGQELSMELGWPLRFVCLSQYGYKMPKCVKTIDFVQEFELGWWELECQYDIDGLIQPGSVLLIGDNPHRIEISSSNQH